MEQAFAGRATLIDNLSERQIIIPARRNWFVLLFIPVWLCGWVLGEVFALLALLKLALDGAPVALFLLLWISFWTYGGFNAVQAFLWNIAGREVITIGSGLLSIERRFQLLKRRKDYDLGEVRGLRVHDPFAMGAFFGNWRRIRGAGRAGTIRFEWGEKTVSFGEGLRPHEAEALLQELKRTRFLPAVNFAGEPGGSHR